MNGHALVSSRRHRASARAVICLVVAVSGCSQGAGPAPEVTGTPSSTEDVDPREPPPSGLIASAPLPTDGPLLAAEPAGRRISLPWHYVDLSADGRVITVLWAGPSAGCADVVGFQVVERADAVSVTAWAVQFADVCDASLRFGRARLTLAAPLGDRVLLHGPVGPGWSAHFFDQSS